MTTNKVSRRALSAFQKSNRRWTPIILPSICPPITKQGARPLPLNSSFSLISQNLDAFSSRSVSKAQLLLKFVLEQLQLPDLVFLQEVTSIVRAYILGNAEIRKAFLVTDAEDQTSFEGIPFANMTLVSRRRFAFDLDLQDERDRIERGEKLMLGFVSRIQLPSKYGRCALSVEFIIPSSPPRSCRLINVHLDSLGDTFTYRSEQMKILAILLRKPGCDGGIIAGDFNAISAEDHDLLEVTGLVDAWVALHGKEALEGATWGVMVDRNGLKPGRLDKVAMLGVGAKEMEILRPGLIEVPRAGKKSDYIPWSDHCGLKLSFSLGVLSSV